MMSALSIWSKAWALLDHSERRMAWLMLSIMIVSAIAAVAMIMAITPFLSVLADPGLIHSVPLLERTYAIGGFTSDYSFLVAMGVLSLLAILAGNLVQVGRAWVTKRFTMMRAHTLSYRLLSGYLRQPYEFFLNRHSGAMSTQILSESQNVINMFLYPAAEVVAAAITTLAIVALLLWVDPVITLSALVILGGPYLVTFLVARNHIARLGDERVEANKLRYRLAHEALGGVKDIKLLGREGSYLRRYFGPSKRMAETLVTSGLLSELPQYVIQAMAFGGMILLSLMSLDADAYAKGDGLANVLPTLGIFAFAGQRLMPELSRLYRGVAQLRYGAPAVDAVYADLMLVASCRDVPLDEPAELGLRQELRLEQVTYVYPNAESPCLADINIAIAAGQKIGIVGGTGAGKTTIGNLILGLLEPTQGRLLVDGVAIAEENIRAWQRTVGYVPQDIFMIDASVSENIALGVPPDQIDFVRVKRAAQIAQIDHFVCQSLIHGYDTTIGERGVRLSGGQRQRIGIARALYHDAALLVFDEATSALDNLTEREVMAAIDALPEHKTAVIIAHRLSTVRRCDRIVVLDKGRVVGCDRWERLLETSKEFRRMATAV